MHDDISSLMNKIFSEDLSGIKIEGEESLKHILQLKKDIREADKGYLTDKNIEIDIDNLTDLPNGRFRTTYEGVTFEMMFNYKKGQPLYVILNGAKTSVYPEFKRWSWYPFIQGSMLNIADPMYAKYPDLKIGWYYGDTKQDYRRVVAAMVKKIAQFLHIEKKNIILYGSSGGGCAGIEVASLIGGGCTCIAINPQIYMRNCRAYSLFVNGTNLTIDENDVFGRDDPIRWINGDCNFIFVENIVSTEDRNDILRFSKQVGFSIDYGITRHKNIIVWAYIANSDRPHNAQEDFYTHFKICFLKELFAYDEVTFDSFKRLYLLFSEEWFNQREAINKNNDIKNQLHFFTGQSQVLVDETNVQIQAYDQQYAAHTINVKSPGNSLYLLELSDLLLNGKNSGSYSIAVKSKDRLLSLNKYDISDKKNKFCFSTDDSPCDCCIRIYADVSGETRGQTLSIGHLVLRLQQ